MLHIEFDPRDFTCREAALKRISSSLKLMLRRDHSRPFNAEQTLLALMELFKNTFDHSSGSASLELQLPGEVNRFYAVYRDTGEAFDWPACATLGVTSKPGNGVNFGLGLGIIERAAEISGMTFSVTRLAGHTEVRIAERATASA